MGDETSTAAERSGAQSESLEARLSEPRYAESLRPPGSLSPRYGVTKMQRLRALGKPPEDQAIPLAEDATVRRGKLEQRRKLVAENFISGLSPQQIAEALDVPEASVRDDIKVIIGRWKKDQVVEIEPHVLKIVERCERMINAFWAKAVAGDPTAQEQVRKNQLQLMRVLGIGQPQQAKPNDAPTLIPIGQGGQTVNIQQFNTLVMRDARELHDNELALIAQMSKPKQMIEGESYGKTGSKDAGETKFEHRDAGIGSVGPGYDDTGDSEYRIDSPDSAELDE